MTFSNSLIVRFVLLLLALAALTGCNYVGDGLNLVGTGFHRSARAVKSF